MRRNKKATTEHFPVALGHPRQLASEDVAGNALQGVHQRGDRNLRRIVHQQVDMVTFAVHLHQLRPEICADLGENVSQVLDRLGVEDAASVFGQEDQMDVQCKHAMSAPSNVLDICHRPECTRAMERRQTFRFELRESGEQRRQMRRYAGCVRFVYNKALALHNGAAQRVSCHIPAEFL
jgi:Helix-turn-helix domain